MKQAFIKRCSFLLFTMMSILTYAQNSSIQVTITGTVTDNTGLPLAGVNVAEKSSKNTTSTDFSGKYKIKVDSGATLVFSFIGMRKMEIPLGGRSTIDLKMQDDSNQLENVVVVGYNTQKKRDITAAVATINTQELERLPVSNLSDALKGLTPGLSVTSGTGRPGDAGTISIRQTFGFSKDGNSTIPLIVIDDMVQVDPQTGKPTLDAFNRLDPSEIESMTVLKDAAAAIYGSRASQGAVVIRTKRGKAGKAKFSYNSQFTVNDAVSQTKTMSAYDFGVFNNRYLLSANQTNPTYSPANLFSANELDQMKSLNYDWLAAAWKPAVQQKHTMNLSGGSDDITYFAGVSYFTQDANLGYQKFDKWNYRTGINAKIANNLDFSASISGNTGFLDKSFTKAAANISDGGYGSNSGGEQADYGYLVHMPKFIPMQTVVDGATYYMSPFPNTNKNLGSANSNTTLAGWNYFSNLASGSHQTTDDSSFNVNASLNYKIAAIKGLSIKGTFARTQSSSFNEQIQLPYDLARITNYQLQDHHLASEAYPSAINKNPIGGTIDYALETNNKNARVYYNSAFSQNTQGDFFINYNRTFGEHQVSAMFGYEGSKQYWSADRLGYINTPKDYLGDYRTAGTVDTSNSTESRGNGATLSYFGTLNYSYQSKYLLQLLLRSDASTKFAPEHYWGTFPSLQAGWIVSKEDWFQKSVSWMDFLKIRYSIGQSGKDNLQAWKWYQFYDLINNKGFQFGSLGGSLGNGLTPKVNPNRDAKWDTTLKQDVGVDFALLKNRLQITYDFYYDKTDNMLTDMGAATGVPISIGGAFAEQNYASVKDWGHELSITWSDKHGRFSYDIGVNTSYNNNEITKYPDAGAILPTDNTNRVGMSPGFNPVYGFKVWKGTSSGDGILRTDQDVTNYWNYLSANATAAGSTPNYLGITNPALLLKGNLAYQDLAGQLKPDGTLGAPDGQITKGNDYGKLANSSRSYGFTTNLGMKYSGFSLKTQIATSWGGANFIDVVSQSTASAGFMWSREPFWNDMYGADNLNGKYPNLAQVSGQGNSDFWQISTFRCVVRNLTVAYDIPKETFVNTKLQNITLGITGYNLWDLYNPYPGKYRNMYDNSSVNYPTLRSWTLNLNISF